MGLLAVSLNSESPASPANQVYKAVFWEYGRGILGVEWGHRLGLPCWRMLDDGDGEISLEEFETGLMRMKGSDLQG